MTWQRKLTPEGAIQRDVKQYLQIKGWWVYKNHQSLGSHKGLADLTAIKNGRTVWIEIKRPTGKQSDYQKQFQADIERYGGIYIVARSVEDVQMLADIERGKE